MKIVINFNNERPKEPLQSLSRVATYSVALINSRRIQATCQGNDLLV